MNYLWQTLCQELRRKIGDCALISAKSIKYISICPLFWISYAYAAPNAVPNVFSLSLHTNPTPEIIEDTTQVVTSLESIMSDVGTVRLSYVLNRHGSSYSEGGMISLGTGNQNSLYAKFSHGTGTASLYTYRTMTRLQLGTKLRKSPIGGFYDYTEKNYQFASHRRLDFAVSYAWPKDLFYIGARIETFADDNLPIMFLISVNHRFNDNKSELKSNLVIGAHYTVTEGVVNKPFIGLKLNTRGKWKPENSPSGLSVSYGIKYLFIRKLSGDEHRIGLSTGVVYEY